MANSSTLKLPVYGMNCASCASRLQSALNTIKGIQATVNFALESAQIQFNDQIDHRETLPAILAMLEEKGYQTDTQTLLLSATGWSCTRCAASSCKIINEHPFVIKAESNFATETVQIQTIQGALNKRDIDDFCKRLPYQFSIKSKHNFKQQNQQKLALQKTQDRKARIILAIATLLSLPFLLSMVNMAINHQHSLLAPWLEFVLATPVQFIIGARFYNGAWRSLKSFTTNMDVLVVLGTSAAYFYSLAIFISGTNQPLYFESSSLVITLITLGKYLEHRAKQSTSGAINALMALRPDTAQVKKGKKFIEINIDEVQVGDLVQVAIGEKVAVDGVVVEGTSYLDEALLTGESKAILKEKGSQVIAGSINGDGVLLVKTLAVGESTSLNKIISLVENAQMSKAPIIQLVDKISAIFVPVILLIATLTFLAWYFTTGDFQYALITSVAVLVIACPCALGLATPTAVVVGTGVAAQHGILIKDIKTLQQAYKLQTIIFDKTGTLTQGKGEISEIVSVDNNNNTLMSKLNALQVGSKHPIAHAVQRYCLNKNIPQVIAQEVKAINGEGIHATLDGIPLIAGNLSMMQRFAITLPEADIDNALNDIASIVYIAYDGKFLGYVSILDSLRPESFQAIQQLQQRNIETVILSGDKHSVVANVSAQLQITHYFAELKPQQKLAQLLTLQKDKQVAMVGDGVNDAPALAAADVSIAMGTGSDVAKQSASITLMRNDPRLVVQAIDISRATWLKIQQNLFWAFIFNTVAIPAAALGYLNPAIAGGAMALSSITVLSNSLLLKRFK